MIQLVGTDVKIEQFQTVLKKQKNLPEWDEARFKVIYYANTNISCTLPPSL